MDSYEDFEFSSPLPVSEALDRLKKHATNPRDGTFYGEIKGNYFNLVHDAGRAKIKPQLSGYILPEGVGCRVFARTHVIGSLDAIAYPIIFTLGSCLYIMAKNPNLMAAVFVFLKSHALQVLGTVILFCTLGGLASWYVMMKFRKRGRFQVISKFMDYLDAGFKVDSAALKC